MDPAHKDRSFYLQTDWPWKGVVIHIHDVFYPFEYPIEWLEEGRAWNEQYFLRAFLLFNEVFKIKLFSTYMIRTKFSWFSQFMPDCLKDIGGCIWIEKIK